MQGEFSYIVLCASNCSLKFLKANLEIVLVIYNWGLFGCTVREMSSQNLDKCLYIKFNLYSRYNLSESDRVINWRDILSPRAAWLGRDKEKALHTTEGRKCTRIP